MEWGELKRSTSMDLEWSLISCLVFFNLFRHYRWKPGKLRFRKVFNKMVSRNKNFYFIIFLLFYFSERIKFFFFFLNFLNKISKGLTMQIYFQRLLCLYLPRESIIRAMTVGFWTTWINESMMTEFSLWIWIKLSKPLRIMSCSKTKH